jgi:trigger factor
VQAQLRQYIANDIILEPKHEQVVSDGDSANINFVGKLDGVEFENGSANDYELIIGSKSFIDNFEQQLIGMKAQETKDINVTFPQQYQEPSLAGKPVTFTVTVNKVSIPKLPEMSEEYLKKFNIDVKDEKEFSKYIENQLYEAKQYQQFTDLKQQITKQIMALSKINYIPEHLLIQEKNRLHDQLTQEASKQNQSLLEHVQQQGYETLDAYDKYEQIMAENNLVFAFAIDKIIQELDIKIDESDLNDYFAKAAKVYNIAPDKIRDVFADHMNSIESFVLHEKVMKTIAEYYV